MSLRLRGYAIGIAGFIYGIAGYGLSIFTYVLGATIGPLFLPLLRHATLKPSMGSDTTIPMQGSDLRHGRHPKKRSSGRTKTLHRYHSDLLANTHQKSVPNDTRLRHAASLDSFRAENSLILVAPVITINHVDRVDNMSIKAPTITLHPSVTSDLRKKQKRRSATISHQHLPPGLLFTEDLPVGAASALPDLEPPWDDSSRIHRSASSPQLASLAGEESCAPGQKPKEKTHSIGLSAKRGKRTTRQEKITKSVVSPSPPLKFFSTFPNIVKKRSHTLRTQPYNEPYCVPLPMPPVSLEHSKLEKKMKRSRTLPAGEIGYPPLQPQKFSSPLDGST